MHRCSCPPPPVRCTPTDRIGPSPERSKLRPVASSEIHLLLFRYLQSLAFPKLAQFPYPGRPTGVSINKSILDVRKVTSLAWLASSAPQRHHSDDDDSTGLRLWCFRNRLQ